MLRPIKALLELFSPSFILSYMKIMIMLVMASKAFRIVKWHVHNTLDEMQCVNNDTYLGLLICIRGKFFLSIPKFVTKCKSKAYSLILKNKQR
jgi:hypothetical protein